MRQQSPPDSHHDPEAVEIDMECKETPRRGRRRAALIALGILITGTMALAAGAFYTVSRTPATTGMLPTRVTEKSPWEPTSPTGERTILLAGVTPTYIRAPVWPYPEAAEDYRGLTDTLMLVRSSTAGIQVISIPRDTWINIAGHGYGKINSANSIGGAPLLVSSVEELTGAHINDVILLNMHAVRDTIDALGGIDVEVPEPMVYQDRAGKLDINLQPGMQHLSGQQAEGFLRWRSDGKGDIGRSERQRIFMKALVSRLANPSSLARMGHAWNAIQRNTRSSMDGNHMIDMARQGLWASRQGIKTELLPGSYGTGGSWIPDHNAIQAMGLNMSLADSMNRPTSEERKEAGPIMVINNNAPAGSARRVAQQLRSLGYQNVTTDNDAGNATQSTVQGPAASLVIREKVTPQAVERSSSNVNESTTQTVITLGSDIENMATQANAIQ